MPVQTYFALLPGSPAIDAGNPAGCTDDLGGPLTDDQRGTSRPLDGNNDGTAVCDIGSYEVDPFRPLTLSYLPICVRPCPVLYFDNFSNPASGWPTSNTNIQLLEYNNGEYRNLMNAARNFGIAVSPAASQQDYRVSVDLRNASGVYGSYGIIFGFTENQGWYTLEIYTDGWYGIYQYDVWGGELLAEAYSPYVNQGTASNHISVVRDGPIITAYVNDHLLTSVSDNTFIGGYFGLINYAYEQPDVDVRYDNFQIDPLDCIQPRPEAVIIPGIVEGVPAFGSDGIPLVINFAKHQP